MIKKLSPKEVKKANKQYKQKKELILIAENMSYARNVASLIRIADALKAKKVYLVGESHTPPFGKDLQKVSRGKERVVAWEHMPTIAQAVSAVKKDGYSVVAIEQCDKSVLYTEYKYPEKVAFVVGSEMFGLSKKTVESVDGAVVIPMYGKGGSINVHVALAVVAFFASVS